MLSEASYLAHMKKHERKEKGDPMEKWSSSILYKSLKIHCLVFVYELYSKSFWICSHFFQHIWVLARWNLALLQKLLQLVTYILCLFLQLFYQLLSFLYFFSNQRLLLVLFYDAHKPFALAILIEVVRGFLGSIVHLIPPCFVFLKLTVFVFFDNFLIFLSLLFDGSGDLPLFFDESSTEKLNLIIPLLSLFYVFFL